ncbi:hypothetical protein [Halobaculum sp. D14]
MTTTTALGARLTGASAAYGGWRPCTPNADAGMQGKRFDVPSVSIAA